MAAVARADTKSLLPVGAIAWYLVFLLFLVLLQIFGGHVVSSKEMRPLNLLVPISFGAANLLLGWRLVRTSPLAIWNPLFWLLLACTLYYAMGQLVHLLGHPDTIQRVNKLYFVDQAGLARTNLLNTVGVMVIVAAYLITALITNLRNGGVSLVAGTEAQDQQGLREAKWAVFLFLLIGLPIKYFLQLPYDLGLLNWVLPGSIKYLSTLSGAAIIPLYWLYKKRGGIYRPLFFSLFASELLAGLVTLSKLEMIKTVLFVVLGAQLVKPGLKKFALSGIMIITAYILVLNPFVNFAREAIGRAAATDFSQAMSLVDRYNKAAGPVRDLEFPHAQLWWSRLAYSNVELFAMRQYDRGHPGATFQLAPYTLIPRFILPGKPTMNSGLEFTYLITGDPNMMSFTGLGVLGEGYWNGGWLGVVVAGSIVGALLAVFYGFSVRMVEARIFMFLPVPMAGVLLGLRIDDWFVPTYLGMTVQLLLMYIPVQFLVRPALLGNANTSERERPNVKPGDVQEEARRRFPLVS